MRGVALGVNEVELELTVETRNVAHGEEVLARLRRAGYTVEPESEPPARPSSTRAKQAARRGPAE